jgi:hypothetical protein
MMLPPMSFSEAWVARPAIRSLSLADRSLLFDILALASLYNDGGLVLERHFRELRPRLGLGGVIARLTAARVLRSVRLNRASWRVWMAC